MAVIKLENGLVLQKASHLFMTLYGSDGYLPATGSQNTYDIRAIVADTINLEQDDNEVNTKEHEFSNSPLLENINLGKFQFTCTCIDFQDDILTELFGCTKDSSGVVMFPSEYKEIFACVRIAFHDGTKDVIIPKLKLNAKAVIGTLKTGSAEGTLSGTAYATDVKPAVSASSDTDVKETSLFMAAPTAASAASAWGIKKVTTSGTPPTTTTTYQTVTY
jgi:hypothetical protein